MKKKLLGIFLVLICLAFAPMSIRAMAPKPDDVPEQEEQEPDGDEQESADCEPELQPKQVLVASWQPDMSGREQAITGHVSGQQEREADKPVSFLPESALALAIIFGSAALVNYFKIDRLWEQYL